MGRAGASDTGCGSGWPAPQDRYAFGDQHDLYLLRTGCLWRNLLRDDFPLRSTVYNIFRKFQAEGTWHAIWDQIHSMLQEGEDREGSPSAGIIDSQTIKSAEKQGYKAGKQTADVADASDNEPEKKVKGRKTH